MFEEWVKMMGVIGQWTPPRGVTKSMIAINLSTGIIETDLVCKNEMRVVRIDLRDSHEEARAHLDSVARKLRETHF